MKEIIFSPLEVISYDKTRCIVRVSKGGSVEPMLFRTPWGLRRLEVRSGNVLPPFQIKGNTVFILPHPIPHNYCHFVNVTLFSVGSFLWDMGFIKELGVLSDVQVVFLMFVKRTIQPFNHYLSYLVSKPILFLEELPGTKFEKVVLWNKAYGYASPCIVKKESTKEKNFYSFIRRHFYTCFGIKDEYDGKIITTIIRRKDRGRKIINVVDLERVLKEEGIEVRSVFIEDLSLKEQFHLFSKTSILIGAHGAGLTNLLWLRPHATVLELFPYKTRSPQYSNMALIGDNPYLWYQSDPVGGVKVPPKFQNFDSVSPDDDYKIHHYLKNFDIKVDVDKFRNLIQQVLMKLKKI